MLFNSVLALSNLTLDDVSLFFPSTNFSFALSKAFLALSNFACPFFCSSFILLLASSYILLYLKSSLSFFILSISFNDFSIILLYLSLLVVSAEAPFTVKYISV